MAELIEKGDLGGHVQVIRKTIVGSAVSLRTGKPIAGYVAAALGLAGVLYRAILMALDVPPANSDEGTAGLAALHIGEGRHWPMFFYGQDYMGTFHSYFAAPLVQVLGTHWWVLRLPALAMYAIFLLLVFRLTRLLYTPWFAAFVMAIMAFGSDRVVKDQIIGAGGYSDVAAAVAGLMLASAVLALQPEKRRMTFAVWGCLAGYIVWTHWLALPYVAAAVLLVVSMSRSELTMRRIFLAVAGFILGAAPLIWFNLRADHANSFSMLLSLSGATEPAAWSDRLHGAVILGLPLSFGMCAPSRCATWQSWWGPIYLIMMGVATAIAVMAMRYANPGERRLQASRLALLAGAAMTLAAYMASSSSAVTPIESARYLHYGLVSLPAVLWPLWIGMRPLVGRVRASTSDGMGSVRQSVTGPSRSGFALAIACIALTGAVFAGLLAATGQLIAHQSVYEAKADEEQQLLNQLRAGDITQIYSEYWTCNRLAYRSGEQIRCAVLDENLKPGFDRYRPYRDQVRQSEQVAYVLPDSSAMADGFTRSAPQTVDIVSVRKIAGYQVYLCRQKPERN